MTWLPNPTVTLGTADVSQFAVGQVSVRRGRDSVYAQTDAGYASVELIDVDGGPDLQVGQSLSVALDDSAGSAVTVFTGLVSDWEAGVRQRFEGDPVVVFRVQAVGPLARMNRRQALSGGRPSEDDGDRVAAAVAGGLGQAYEELDYYAWSSVGTAVTYDTFDPLVDLSLIDPGVYLLSALGTADGGYSALSVAQEAADSGAGVLFETASGLVGYGDADRRAANGTAYLDIPVGDVAADSLRVSSSLSDLVNRAIVEYDGGAAQQDDTWSIIEYGVQAQTTSTILANLSNAEDRAEDIILRLASPQKEFSSVRVNMLTVGSALRDSLLDLNTNDAVSVSGLPEKLGLGEVFEGFVEGVEWTADTFRADLNLFVSDRRLSVGGTRWGQVSATLEWQAVGSAVTWADARTL